MARNVDDIQYTPPPSIGHELGIMFGFLAIMAISMAVYGVAWQMGNKRSARKEEERVQALKASGWLKEKAPFGGEGEKVEHAHAGEGAGADVGRPEPTEIKM